MQELNIVERVIALENVELLKGLTPDQLARIAAIATQESLPPGKVLFTPEQNLDAMFIIVDGAVELLRGGAPLEVARQNDVVGSWALLDSAPLPVTARALEDTVVLRVAREDFYELLSDNTEIVSAIFSTLVRRFRALLEHGSGS
jgi:CRP-like cAMP-binding protein